MGLPLLLIPLLTTAAGFAGAGGMSYWATTNIMQTRKISADRARELAWEKQKYLLQHQEFLSEQEFNEKQSEIDYLRDIAKMDRYQQYQYQEQEYQTSRDYQLQQYERERDEQLQAFERGEQDERLLANFFQSATEMEFERQQTTQRQAFGIYENMFQAGQQNQRLEAEVNMAEFQQARDIQEREIYLEEKAYEAVTGNSFSQLIGDETNVFKLTYILQELERMVMPQPLKLPEEFNPINDFTTPLEYSDIYY